MRLKEVRDQVMKYVTRGNSANSQFGEFAEYFRVYGPINFDYQISKETGLTVAKSTNFKYGTIITSGRNPKEVDENIKDAILTSFDIPSVYATEANITKVGDRKVAQYALA